MLAFNFDINFLEYNTWFMTLKSDTKNMKLEQLYVKCDTWWYLKHGYNIWISIREVRVLYTNGTQ